jgi:hypothetical protein
VFAASELPPVPPAGAFDIRFVSQHWMGTFAGSDGVPIACQSVSYPLTVRWDSPAGSNVVLRADESDIALRSGGEATLRAPASRLALRLSGNGETPKEFALHQNYPNPFNPTTDIRFDIPEAGFVSLRIFDLLGREVSVLVQELRGAGRSHATWNAANAPSGIYYARMTATSPTGELLFQSTKKLVLAK